MAERSNTKIEEWLRSLEGHTSLTYAAGQLLIKTVRDLIAENDKLLATRGLLKWLNSMTSTERGFVDSLLAHRADFFSLEVFADWLEEEDRLDESRRIRLLCPQTGDVLLIREPARVISASYKQNTRQIAQSIRQELLKRGRDCLVVCLPADWNLEHLTPDQRNLLLTEVRLQENR